MSTTKDSNPASPVKQPTDALQSTVPDRPAWQVGFLRALKSIGPFAISLTTYGLMLDHLPDSWFKYGALRYILAGALALLLGIGTRLAVELASRKPNTPRVYSPPAVTGAEEQKYVSAHSLLNQTVRRVVADCREIRRDDTVLTGWSQYMGDDVQPTAIGTSYGLRTLLALDVRDTRVNRADLVQTLLNLQREGGGWAASTQRGIARPEVTAWVAGAVCRAGVDATTRATIIARLEELIAAPDPVAHSRTTILTILILALADIAPGSALLPGLADRLVSGAELISGEPATASWGETVGGTHRRSVPHTARAVVALDRAARALGGGFDHANVLASGIEWLSRDGLDLSDKDEQIRRPLPTADVDVLLVGHFTPAWVVRALMCGADPTKRAPFVNAALPKVIQAQENGIWIWHDGSRPTWMTYQGTIAVREYALRSVKWGP